MTTPTQDQGRTEVATQVLTQIARRAALSIPGVVTHSSGINKLTGREFPRINVQRDHDGADLIVDAQVAVRWPSPITTVAQTVRSAIAEWITSMTGYPLTAVNVEVAAVVPAELPAEDRKQSYGYSPAAYPQERVTAREVLAAPRSPLVSHPEAEALDVTPVSAPPERPTRPIDVLESRPVISPVAPRPVTPYRPVAPPPITAFRPQRQRGLPLVHRVVAPPVRRVGVPKNPKGLPVTITPRVRPRRSPGVPVARNLPVTITPTVDPHRVEDHEDLASLRATAFGTDMSVPKRADGMAVGNAESSRFPRSEAGGDQG